MLPGSGGVDVKDAILLYYSWSRSVVIAYLSLEVVFPLAQGFVYILLN